MKKHIIILCLLLLMGTLTACAQNQEEYSYTGFAMGTTVSETIYSSGGDRTKDVENCLTEVEDKWISWKKADSEITAVNKSAGESGRNVSAETVECLRKVLKIAEDSDGAFDPTIGNITRLWNLNGGNTKVPGDDKIRELLKNVGYKNIQLSGNKVTLEKDASIDLGAAGKGMGCDEIKKLLDEDSNVSGAVINIGGSSIMTYGEKPDGSPWKVAVTDPRATEDYLGVLQVEGEQYISTSGDYEKYFMKGNTRYHHIMDPKTGYPSRSGLISVTVIGDNGLESDALATACFVLGKEKGMKLAEKYGVEAIFVNEEKQIFLTDGAKKIFELTQDGYRLTED